MPIFQLKGEKLLSLERKSIDLEKDIQKITESNLNSIFGLTFVSGSLSQEFSVGVQEQDFYIDTLAFDEVQKSFVIIEYKKDKNFSVIDQGFAYLSAMLINKADFILELNERLNKNYKKSDIDWGQSRIIFISPEFTNYQKNAINFKDLPIFLYEIKLYDNNIIDYNFIKPQRSSESIKKITKDKTIQGVIREVKVYDIDDLVKPGWTDTRELLGEFEKELLSSEYETKIKYTKVYIAYMSKHGRNYVEIVPQQQGLKIYYRFPVKYIKSELKIFDCSKIGRLANGVSFVLISDANQIPEAIRLAKESYKYLHRDI